MYSLSLRESDSDESERKKEDVVVVVLCSGLFWLYENIIAGCADFCNQVDYMRRNDVFVRALPVVKFEV